MQIKGCKGKPSNNGQAFQNIITTPLFARKIQHQMQIANTKHHCATINDLSADRKLHYKFISQLQEDSFKFTGEEPLLTRPAHILDGVLDSRRGFCLKLDTDQHVRRCCRELIFPRELSLFALGRFFGGRKTRAPEPLKWHKND